MAKCHPWSGHQHLHCCPSTAPTASSIRQPQPIPQHRWRQGRNPGGRQPHSWQGNSRREQGHTAGSKLDRLFNSTLTENISGLLPTPGTASCPPFLPASTRGGRGWAAREGGWQGTPVRLDDPLEQKGKTLAGDALAVSAHREEHLKNSSSAVKSSQKQKLLLPCLPAPHQAEPSTIHPTKHHQCDEHMVASSSLSPSLFLARGWGKPHGSSGRPQGPASLQCTGVVPAPWEGRPRKMDAPRRPQRWCWAVVPEQAGGTSSPQPSLSVFKAASLTETAISTPRR